jgi:N-hydroxyarylamine O-acetyltransferase
MMDTAAYLARIGFDRPVTRDLATLRALQQAHLSTVPFENLHLFHRLGVRTDTSWSLAKIVDQRRGGWCFENNGAFAWLLEALGFDVIRLGAAVLLGGPNAMVDHLTLEVMLDEPWLVDVGFGDSFTVPLGLNRRSTQDGGTGTYELIDSSQGLTLTRHDDAGVPVPQYRFKRVAHAMPEFDAASDLLQADEERHWVHKPFATRLLDGGPDRVTLLTDRLKLVRDGVVTETVVPAEHWDDTLDRWFAMRSPAEPRST